MKVRMANVPKPTKIGDEVFLEKTFLNRSFIFLGFSKFVKYGWVQSLVNINLKRVLKFDG